MLKLFYFLLLSFFSVSCFGFAPEPTLEDSRQEAQVHSMARKLYCMTCQGQTVAESESPFAKEVRKFLRKAILHGKSEKQIMEYITLHYGESIRVEPLFHAKTLLLWLGPFLFLIIAIFIFIVKPMRRG